MAETKENVVIQSGDCVLTMLPALGGKISSLRVNGHELLQAPLNPYRSRTPSLSFAESDAGGWDECLPSVAACRIETPAGPVEIPDHGDLWGVPWQILQTSEDSATLRVQCSSLPLELTRSAILSSSSSGWRLNLLYSLTNLGTHPVPWSWSAHPLFAVDAGDRISLPQEVQSLRIENSAGDRFGADAVTAAWPVASSPSGASLDVNVAQDAHTGVGDKLFAGPLREGWCTLERRQIGLQLTVRFDPQITPYLGLWLCYGGWPDGPGPKQVCVAPEPTTAPSDSLAETGAWSRSLEHGETCTWPMDLNIDLNIDHNIGHIGPSLPGLASGAPR